METEHSEPDRLGRIGDDPIEPRTRASARGRIVLAFFTVAAAYFLWTEHRAHVIEYLPWAFVAACPLMHLFMHRGHAGHEERHPPPDDERGRHS